MSEIKIPLAGSDKAPVEEKPERNYAGARIMNPFPNKILLTPSEAVQAINLISGLLMADERFQHITAEDFAQDGKRYGNR
jgi:hypothetical protein